MYYYDVYYLYNIFHLFVLVFVIFGTVFGKRFKHN